LLLRLVQVKKE